MKRIIVAAVSLGALVAGSRMLAAPGQTTARPGDMTQARVFIENHGSTQAIPVSLENYVTIAPNSTVRIAVTRQPWEHRLLTIAAGTDADVALRQAGVDGWEAVGMQQGPSGLVVLLKRPRT